MLTTATCLALALALVMLSADYNDGFPAGLGLLDDSATESDTDYEDEGDEGDAEFEFGDGGGWVPKKKTKSKGSPAANGGLPNFSTGAYDTTYWSCEQVGSGGQFVRMVDTEHGGAYNVPFARVNKALRFLHLPTIAATLRAGNGTCRCKRSPKCYERGLTTCSILGHRHMFFQQLNEYGATKYLADLVRPHNVQPTRPDNSKSVYTV